MSIEPRALRRTLLAVLVASGASLQFPALGADLDASIQFATQADGGATLTNVCVEPLNFSVCFDAVGSSRPCSAAVEDVFSLFPGNSVSFPTHAAEGGGKPHLAVCAFNEAPVKWKPLDGTPVVCKRTCVMC